MKKESTQERLDRIHKAVTTLVSNRDINTISIYDVAKEASIATSTVYHHYPNMEALVYRLMEDIFEDFKSVLASAIKPEDIHHWSDINRMVEQGFVDYYSSNPLVQRILLGQHTYSSIRHADAENDVILAEQVESIYRKYFKLPQLPEDVNIFAIALQVADKVYSMNYRENGNIPKEMAREAVILTEAYLGVYLPKHLPKSEEVITEDISLH